jgi:hypothetical protein
MDDDACIREITDGASDVSGRHIVSWILVETHQENSFVMTVRGKDDEIVERLEISVVSAQERTLSTNRVC